MSSVIFMYYPFPHTLRNARRCLGVKVQLFGNSGEHVFEKINENENFYEYSLLNVTDIIIKKTKGTVIDIGANLGNHSIFFSKISGKSVLSVEPYKKNIKYLEKNVRANGVEEKVDILKKVVSDKVNEIHKFEKIKGKNLGDIRMKKTNDKKNKTVKSTTVDTIVRQHNISVSTIKIDVQGMESNVLKGAENTIRNQQPVLIVEVNNKETRLRLESIKNNLGYNIIKSFRPAPTLLLSPERTNILTRKCYLLWSYAIM